jgi:rhamnopyranosyl-N-acetylglucosaminyl-diphospho-decaprenol beta-1,3/1,4-galactofuranosyltransferase
MTHLEHRAAAPGLAYSGCVAVVVTMDRPELLHRLLEALNAQTAPLLAIVVVDNGGLDETSRVVAQHANTRHLISRRNLGGAGGYAYGILHGLALGAERIWLMDDDGYPESPECLAELSRAMDRDGYAMVSPLVVDIDHPDKLAFYYYRNGLPLNRRAQLAQDARFPQFAHLFNGALVHADAFERYGLPRYELFFRGDETDFMYRLKRGGAKFATIGTAAFLHPSGDRDTLPIMGGRFHAIVPASGFARYYYYRNRGNLFREFGLVRAMAYDLVRYSWAFLITRRGDTAGLADWFRAVTAGWKRAFRPYAERPEP